MPPVTATLMLVLYFRSGFFRGSLPVIVRPVAPSGARQPAIEWLAYFEGDDDRGTVLLYEVRPVLEEEGVYWFEILFQEELVTRIPLRVIYQRAGIVQAEVALP